MRVLLRTLYGLLAAVVAVGLLAFTSPASADSSPCPPGQPSGRPPGQSPQQPGKPTGRPPQYPPGECNLALSKSSVSRGESVQVTGGGFAPGDDVALSLDPGAHPLGTVHADGAGSFAQTVTVPEDAPLGSDTVLATSANRQLSAALQVTAKAAGGVGSAGSGRGSGSLPRTGFEIAATAALGMFLIAIGVLAVSAARRTRAATRPA